MSIKESLAKVKNNKLAINAFCMLLGQGARLPIQAIYFILIAKSLGAQGYGAFLGVTALVSILAPFVSLGSGNILVKYVARDKNSFPKYWGKALILTLLSGAILVIIAIPLSMGLLPATISCELILSIAIADLIFSRFLDICAQAYQAFQRLSRTSQLLVLPNVIRLLLLVGLLLFMRHPSPVIWGYFYLASVLISSILGIFLVNWELGKPVFDRYTIFSEIKDGFYFSVSLSSQNIYNDIDKTMLTRLATLEAAGIYGVAYRIIDVSFIPIRSLLYAAYARFFKSGVSGIKGTISFCKKLLPYSVSYGLATSLVLFLLAPILPSVLGSEYVDTVIAIRWLSLLPLLKSIHYFAADTLTGAGLQGIRSICQLITAALNVTLIIWLIPTFSWRGAAFASIASDTFLALFLWILVLLISKSERLQANNLHELQV